MLLSSWTQEATQGQGVHDRAAVDHETKQAALAIQTSSSNAVPNQRTCNGAVSAISELLSSLPVFLERRTNLASRDSVISYLSLSFPRTSSSTWPASLFQTRHRRCDNVIMV